jgi:hypothetical protein
VSQQCIQEENIGRFKEFMENTKGVKATLFTIAVTILLQVGTFLYLWGGLTTTVKAHEVKISQVYQKLDNVQLVGYVYAEPKQEKK